MAGSTNPSITVDFDSAVPVYQQIADEIRALVARGELRDGDGLPSVRQLGGQVGVNLNTVARAYRTLAEEGLVELRQGASARVRIPDAPYRSAMAPDDERRLDDLISRWVLAGADRARIEELIGGALDRFFAARTAGSVDGGGS